MKFTSIITSALAASSAMADKSQKEAKPMIGDAINTFKQNHVNPLVHRAGEKIVEFREKSLRPMVNQAGSTVTTFKEGGFAVGMTEVGNAVVDGAQAAGGWVKEHPYLTAWYAFNGAIIVAPGIMAWPFMALAGFGANGVRAGSLAAGAQSATGVITSPSMFSTIQSAAASGYGAPVVHGAIRAAAIGSSAITAGASWVKEQVVGAVNDENQDEGRQDGEDNPWKPKSKL